MPEGVNPYVGPVSFTEGQKLYGRDREMEELEQLLLAERIVLLRSPSGAGKTSLIQAKLIPKLRDESGFRVWPIMRVNTLPPAGYAGNRYLFSCLEALRQVSGAAGDTMEAVLGAPKPPDLLIFDQFEEVLTLDATDVEAKREFFTGVGECLRNRNRWALFSMREEYVASLDAYLRYLPTRLRTVYRLDRLDLMHATEAIQNPARDAGVTFTDEAARQLAVDLSTTMVQREDGTLDAVPGNYVETVQLQVVCSTLWTKPRANADAIDVGDLGTAADLNTALSDYYSERVAKVAGGDDEAERLIRQWFERRLISPGPQNIRLQVLRGSREQELADAVIGQLIAAYLVRPEKRLNSTWYELAHDRLIKPVLESNEAWRDSHGDAFRDRVDLWEAQDYPDSLLLLGPELKAALKRDRLKLTSVEAEFLKRSQAAQARAEAEKRQTWITRVALVAAVGMSIAAWVLFGQEKDLLKKEKDAESAATAEFTREKKAESDSTAASAEASQYKLLANTAQALVWRDRALEARSHENWPVVWMDTLAALGKPLSNGVDVSDLLGLLLETEAAPRKDWRAYHEATVLDFRQQMPAVNGVTQGYEYPVAFWAGAGGKLRLVMMREPAQNDPMHGMSSVRYGYRLGSYPDAAGAGSWTASGFPQVNIPDLFVFHRDGGEVLSWLSTNYQASAPHRFAIQPIAAAPAGGSFQAQDTTTGKPVRQLALRADGRQFAALRADSSIMLQNVGSGAAARSTVWKPRLDVGENGKLASIAYSAANRFAAGDAEGAIFVWASPGATAPPLRCQSAGGNPIDQVAFSPANENLLAVADRSGTVMLWNAPGNGKCGLLAALGFPAEAIEQIGFTPNGDTLIALSRTGSIRLMPLRLEAAGRKVNLEPILFAPQSPENVAALAALLEASAPILGRDAAQPDKPSRPEVAAAADATFYGASTAEAFSFGHGDFTFHTDSNTVTWNGPTGPAAPAALTAAYSPVKDAKGQQAGYAMTLKPGLTFQAMTSGAAGPRFWQMTGGAINGAPLLVNVAALQTGAMKGKDLPMSYSGFSFIHRWVGSYDGWQTGAMDGTPFYFAEIQDRGAGNYRTFQLRAADAPQSAGLKSPLTLRIPKGGGMAQMQSGASWTDFAYAASWKPAAQISAETTLHDEAGRPILFSLVSLNGKGKAIEAAPGEQITVDLHWKAMKPAPDGMVVQAYYGIGDIQNPIPNQCFVSAYPGLGEADDHSTFTAPRAPGVYYVVVHYWDLYGCAQATMQTNDWTGALGSVLVRPK